MIYEEKQSQEDNSLHQRKKHSLCSSFCSPYIIYIILLQTFIELRCTVQYTLAIESSQSVPVYFYFLLLNS